MVDSGGDGSYNSRNNIRAIAQEAVPVREKEKERAVPDKGVEPAREEHPDKRSLPRPWEAIPARQTEQKSWGGQFSIPITVAVMCLLTYVVHVFKVPNPNILLISGLTVCTSLYGYGAGVVSGMVMLFYSMYFFSENNSFFTFSTLNMQKMTSILLGITLNVMFIGRLKHIQTAAHRELLRMNALLRDDNQSLEQASALDSLTGTRNRFAFRRDYIKYERRNIHVMMFDLDDFKHTNDACGHAVGDFVLRNVGEALGGIFGQSFCYRYVGDEFLVICPDMEETAFVEKVDGVRETLHRLTLDGRHIPARFSAGYVYGTAELSVDLRLMLRHADHNLYVAKERGKDQFHGSAYDRDFAERLAWTVDGGPIV